MLRSTVSFYRRLVPPSREADAFAELITSLDEAGWQRLIDRVPPAIADANPQSFGETAAVTAAALRELAEL